MTQSKRNPNNHKGEHQHLKFVLPGQLLLLLMMAVFGPEEKQLEPQKGNFMLKITKEFLKVAVLISKGDWNTRMLLIDHKKI